MVEISHREERAPPTPANPVNTVLRGLGTIVYHVAEVFLRALAMTKEPVSLILGCLLIVALLAAVASLVVDGALSAIRSCNPCLWPLVSILPVCAAPSAGSFAPGKADFPRLMAIQHNALDGILGQSATGMELALHIRHAEFAVQDLIGSVHESNLTIRAMLGDALAEFSVDARKSSRAMQEFSAMAYGTIDRMSAFNTLTLQQLQAAQQQGHLAAAEAALAQTFPQATDVFATHISQLLVEASTTAIALDKLGQSLSTIHALCVHEERVTAIEEDRLLWQLWTILGGNREQRLDLKHRATVLQEVQYNRRIAAAYITAAAQSLSGVDADLTALRRWLRAPWSSEFPGIPIETHIDSLTRGMDRLKEERLKLRSGPEGYAVEENPHGTLPPSFVQVMRAGP